MDADQDTEYNDDLNGNMIKDQNHGLSSIQYNVPTLNNMSIDLDLGKPTKVNVDYRPGASSNDGMGDHFVVIQGKTEQLSQGRVVSTSFNFYNPGTRDRDNGTSPLNVLMIRENRMEGLFLGRNRSTVVTSIRPSK